MTVLFAGPTATTGGTAIDYARIDPDCYGRGRRTLARYIYPYVQLAKPQGKYSRLIRYAGDSMCHEVCGIAEDQSGAVTGSLEHRCHE